MKIKLAILEQDKEYLQRIVTVFSTRFGEKFDLYSFTDEELALKTVREVKMDVLVADASFDINTALLPKQCSFAYFVESAEIESYKDEAAISKYQKAELIYKQILSLYAERIQGITGLKIGEDPCKVFAFGSVAGGTGASTMAAACAYHFAQAGTPGFVLEYGALRLGGSLLPCRRTAGHERCGICLKGAEGQLPFKAGKCSSPGSKRGVLLLQSKDCPGYDGAFLRGETEAASGAKAGRLL